RAAGEARRLRFGRGRGHERRPRVRRAAGVRHGRGRHAAVRRPRAAPPGARRLRAQRAAAATAWAARLPAVLHRPRPSGLPVRGARLAAARGAAARRGPQRPRQRHGGRPVSIAERLVNRLATAGSRRPSRRKFLAAATLTGTALAVDPIGFLIRPQSAYAAVCGPDSRCAPGYTVMCCTIYGRPHPLPPPTL